MKRVKLYVALLLAGVFVLGVITGGALAHIRIGHKMRHVLGGPPEEAEARVLVFHLNRELGLSETQRLQITNIVLRDHSERAALHRSVEPQLAEIRARERTEIRGLLDARQQAKFDLLSTQFELRRKRALGMP